MENSFSGHIGGAFIYSENPHELADWYQKHLCIEYKLVSSGGASFASFYYKSEDKNKKSLFAWAIIKSKYRTNEEEEPYMINFRVNDLSKLVSHLQSLGVNVKETVQHQNRNCTWIIDPEGNQIELWEECN